MSADDDKVKQFVLDTLQATELKDVDFQLSNIKVSSDMYQKVLQAIVDGKISVLVQPDLLKEKEAAKYFPEMKFRNGDVWYDVLAFRSSDQGSTRGQQITAAALMVHECTHAGFVLLKIPKMTHTFHEAGAYAAEAIFEIARMSNLGGHPDKVVINEPIRKEAWDFGLLLQRSRANSKNKYYTSPDFAVVYYKSLNKLMVAIMNSDEYKPVAKDIVENLGVGRKWILH